jgi:glycosyltransferase involved in cell wall biosynthesis
VSVVMGTFNGERYLHSAIDSILQQTFRDFELIVIDDCSTDQTPNILREINDPRIRAVRNTHNLGIPSTLNKGIELALGKYIAFQDHDDLSMADRLSLQAEFLERHPKVAMVGSSCRVVDASGATVRDYPAKCDDAELRWDLLWYNPFFQTTLMLRRDALREIGGYSSDPRYRLSEDYEMMSRLAMRYRVANLSQFLGCWREHLYSTSAPDSQGKRLLQSRRNISLRNVRDVWHRSGERISADALSKIYEGMWSFQFLTNDEVFRSSPHTIRCALEYLMRLECWFSSTTPGLHPTSSVRAKRYYRWGRHATALALRSNWNLTNREGLTMDAIRFFWRGIRILARHSVSCGA